MVDPLQICVLTHSDQVEQGSELHLDPSRYVVHQTAVLGDTLDWLQSHPELPDCLVVNDKVWRQALRPALIKLGLMLPVVVLIGQTESTAPDQPPTNSAVPLAGAEAYPGAVVHLADDALPQLDWVIQNAIQEFLQLPSLGSTSATAAAKANALSDGLSAQQHRLTEKLKARLGYLGVYYKRSPSSFLRHMSPDDRTAFLSQLKADYRIIVLGYFAKDAKINLNQLIDDFVDQAFMADISVAQIVEIHMELMDSFSKQLKLEGRSEEILLDYRLTLIDVIAHLCEMYRRSVPRQV
ncbi:circadian clock protein KaiA [Leptolyngbya sp. CCNP1308]|uniref:circadian clock protein KaiA n=1 Tax=Leptolyngbya sp. CCNP1308 TaxID=3110255 RepID=UPI002B1F11AA|nr:circadian clock protein KaiA [Leptolyngbya sp. CCNP1308]MEA5450735.1 circadian clock protein KaiA [Leptolyngbya sp. CCNP1308]